MEKNELKSRMFEEAIKMVLRDYHNKEIDEFNSITESDKHIFSPEFEAKMSKILKRGRRFKADFKLSALKFMKKSAVVILIVLSISFLSLLSVKAVRTEIYKIITTFYEKFIDIRYGSTDNQNSKVYFIPEAIEETYLPSYLPDGYWEDTISKSDNNIRAFYVNSENQTITYYQDLLSNAMSIDGEDYIVNNININGMDGEIYEYDKPDDISYCILTLNDNKYFYRLVGYLSKDEMIKIAESIRVQKTEE